MIINVKFFRILLLIESTFFLNTYLIYISAFEVTVNITPVKIAPNSSPVKS